MAIVNKTMPIAVQCLGELNTAINADPAITAILQETTITNGVDAAFTFSTTLSGAEDTALDAVIAAWDNSLCDFASAYDVSVQGMSHQLQFGESGTAKDEWLECYGDAKYSNSTMAVMPFKSKLVGMTFSNKKKSVEADLRIYSTPLGGAATPKTLDYTWMIRNSRVAYKSDFNADIIFDAGDKLAIYIADQGTDPQNVNVIMYFVVIDDVLSESSETWSGDYSTGTGGGSS